MPGLFQALEIGKRALLSNQYNLQTIGHNIANVDTPGYTRQRVTITAAYPADSPEGPIGTGVQVQDVRQIRDLYLGQQYRDAQKSLGQWTYRQKTLAQVESLFNEPQDNSLSDVLNQFWDSWSELSTNSDSVNNRQMVLAQAETLVNGFHQLSRNLEKLRASIDSDLAAMTSEVNRLTTQIGELNRLIQSSEVGGANANDLRDARDLLIDELSNIIDVQTVEKANGANTVFMGAMILVDGVDVMPLEARTENEDGQPISRLVWRGTDVQLTNINGQLSGLLVSRDETIPHYLDQLDQLAESLVTRVNQLHAAGYGADGSTGVNFFDPRYTDASTIRINSEIELNIDKIVASSGVDGDNLTALAISDLRNRPVLANDSMSINDFYNSLVGKLGVEANEAESLTNNFELLVNQVDNSRQAVQGVSLDEEMANLVKFQHAYDAAARVITTMDEALDTVISNMGVVGR